MNRRKRVVEDAIKRWTKRKIRSISQIGTRERLCEEVWRPALVKYIRKTGVGMKGPDERDAREEWEIQIDCQ